MDSIFKPDSFIKNNENNKKLVINDTYTNSKKIIKNNYKKKLLKNKMLNLIRDRLIVKQFKEQEFILDMLMELRGYDEKNGTCIFKNIIYNDLYKFILKNNS
jgi:hypothetical protein